MSLRSVLALALGENSARAGCLRLVSSVTSSSSSSSSSRLSLSTQSAAVVSTRLAVRSSSSSAAADDDDTSKAASSSSSAGMFDDMDKFADARTLGAMMNQVVKANPLLDQKQSTYFTDPTTSAAARNTTTPTARARSPKLSYDQLQTLLLNVKSAGGGERAEIALQTTEADTGIPVDDLRKLTRVLTHP